MTLKWYQPKNVNDTKYEGNIENEDYPKNTAKRVEYVQRCVLSSNVQVPFVFEVVLIVVFHRRSSSIKGCLPSKVVFHERSSSVKGCLLSKVIFHRRSSSSFGSFSFLAFSTESGIAQLSLLLFVYSSWSTSMTSIIFVFDLFHLNDLFCNE